MVKIPAEERIRMFHVGDFIIYSEHGICQIDDICEKTFFGVTRSYYILHPLDDPQLTINAPVDNEQVVMLKMMERDEAEAVLHSFQSLGAKWIEKTNDRLRTYAERVKTGNRKEVANIVNTMMRKQIEVERNGRKLSNSDCKLLDSIQNILFNELAISLNTTYDAIYEQVTELINENLYVGK